MDNQDKNWPAYYYGPDGASQVFQSQGEVPSGWKDHPSKLGEKLTQAQQPKAAVNPIEKPANNPGDPNTPPKPDSTATGAQEAAVGTAGGSDDLDADGHPWSADLHTTSRSKTKAGLWRMKVGSSRPAAAQGYPKPLDL